MFLSIIWHILGLWVISFSIQFSTIETKIINSKDVIKYSLCYPFFTQNGSVFGRIRENYTTGLYLHTNTAKALCDNNWTLVCTPIEYRQEEDDNIDFSKVFILKVLCRSPRREIGRCLVLNSTLKISDFPITFKSKLKRELYVMLDQFRNATGGIYVSFIQRSKCSNIIRLCSKRKGKFMKVERTSLVILVHTCSHHTLPKKIGVDTSKNLSVKYANIYQLMTRGPRKRLCFLCRKRLAINNNITSMDQINSRQSFRSYKEKYITKRSSQGFKCPPNCQGGCDENTGMCRSKSCRPGFQGVGCNESCPQGFYGSDCVHRCQSQCLDSQCHPRTGHCFRCVSGYSGKFCTVRCHDGFYGQGCINVCSEMCENAECDFRTGDCHSCLPGYFGPTCNKLCPPTTYGRNCSFNCSKTCASECDGANGECALCIPGYTGPTCNQSCSNGTFGAGCRLPCSSGCLYHECLHTDGRCFFCKTSLRGDFCQETTHFDNSSSLNNSVVNVTNITYKGGTPDDDFFHPAIVAALIGLGISFLLCIICLLVILRFGKKDKMMDKMISRPPEELQLDKLCEQQGAASSLCTKYSDNSDDDSYAKEINPTVAVAEKVDMILKSGRKQRNLHRYDSHDCERPRVTFDVTESDTERMTHSLSSPPRSLVDSIQSSSLPDISFETRASMSDISLSLADGSVCEIITFEVDSSSSVSIGRKLDLGNLDSSLVSSHSITKHGGQENNSILYEMNELPELENTGLRHRPKENERTRKEIQHPLNPQNPLSDRQESSRNSVEISRFVRVSTNIDSGESDSPLKMATTHVAVQLSQGGAKPCSSHLREAQQFSRSDIDIIPSKQSNGKRTIDGIYLDNSRFISTIEQEEKEKNGRKGHPSIKLIQGESYDISNTLVTEIKSKSLHQLPYLGTKPIQSQVTNISVVEVSKPSSSQIKHTRSSQSQGSDHSARGRRTADQSYLDKTDKAKGMNSRETSVLEVEDSSCQGTNSTSEQNTESDSVRCSSGSTRHQVESTDFKGSNSTSKGSSTKERKGNAQFVNFKLSTPSSSALTLSHKKNDTGHSYDPPSLYDSSSSPHEKLASVDTPILILPRSNSDHKERLEEETSARSTFSADISTSDAPSASNTGKTSAQPKQRSSRILKEDCILPDHGNTSQPRHRDPDSTPVPPNMSFLSSPSFKHIMEVRRCAFRDSEHSGTKTRLPEKQTQVCLSTHKDSKQTPSCEPSDSHVTGSSSSSSSRRPRLRVPGLNYYTEEEIESLFLLSSDTNQASESYEMAIAAIFDSNQVCTSCKRLATESKTKQSSSENKNTKADKIQSQIQSNSSLFDNITSTQLSPPASDECHQDMSTKSPDMERKEGSQGASNSHQRHTGIWNLPPSGSNSKGSSGRNVDFSRLPFRHHQTVRCATTRQVSPMKTNISETNELVKISSLDAQQQEEENSESLQEENKSNDEEDIT